MNIADYIIDRREHDRAPADQAPDGFYTDDMGFWVEQDIRKNRERFASYILSRCLRRHDDIYKWRGELWSGHTQILPTPQSIIALADICDMITPAQAIWIHNRLMEIADELDETKIQVCSNAYWDFEKCELINYCNKNTGEEDDTRR